jgi:hypothetical protein
MRGAERGWECESRAFCGAFSNSSLPLFASAPRFYSSLLLFAPALRSKITIKEVCKVKDYEGLCKLWGVEMEKERGESEEGIERKYDDEYFLKEERKDDSEREKKKVKTAAALA